MHSVQASKSRHNIFSRVDHDQNYVKAQISPKKTSPIAISQTETKGLSSSSSLPNIDFHVRKKLASGDLAAKLHTKTGVVTVASTLGIEEGQSGMFQSSRRGHCENSVFDYNEELDGNQSFRSDTSEPSIRLENFKRNLADSLQNKDSADGDGFFEAGFDDEIMDDVSFGPSITSPDYVSISKQDHTKFQSPLDAHKKFIKAVRSKNHSSSMKAVSSRKVIPTTSQKMLGYNNSFISSKSSMSHNDDASVASEVAAVSGLTPSHNPNQNLVPKTASFLFLSSVKSLAPTIFEEKGEEEEEDLANATLFGNSTFAPFASTENLGERALSPSAKAPLENTSTPVLPKVLTMRSFSRFNSSAEDNSRLMLRMLDSQKLSSSSKDNNSSNIVAKGSNNYSSPPASKAAGKRGDETLGSFDNSHVFDESSVASAANPSNLLSQVLSPIVGMATGTSSSPATNSPQTQNDPYRKSLYHVPSLQDVRNKKKNFTDWIDEKIRALTFVPAPPKPATPPPEEVPPVTLESLFGESLLHANIDKKAEPISDETYQRILRETHEKQKQMMEEQYRLHNINGNEQELIKELERDFHYREQQRLQELQQSQLQPEEREHEPVDPNEVYSSTYMEPLGIPPRKPMAVPKSSSKSITSSLGTEMMMSTPPPKESNLPMVSSAGAMLPKLDLTPVLQRQQQQQPYQSSHYKDQQSASLPQKKCIIPRSETFLAASSFDVTAQGDDNASVLSFSSSITSLPGMFNHTGKPTNAATGIGTRLPSINQNKANPTQSLFQSPESKHTPLPEQKERIVYHDPFSTMFAYTSDDIKHYASALNPDTQIQLQRLYSTDPSVPKHSPEAAHKVFNPDVKSFFDISDDLLQPLEKNAVKEPKYAYQHSTTSYVLQDWENYASKGIPNELPSFATDPKTLAKQDHERIVESMVSQSITGKNQANEAPLVAKSPRRKREIDALNVLSATKLNRKLTLEDIDTTYSSLRHQSQMLTYSTTAQQELAQTANNAEVKRIYSILNPGPHEAVIFLPPDHAKFAQEMRETYHSLPSGLLAYTQDKELMHEIERQTQQVNVPGQSYSPNNEYAQQNETLSARDSRLKSLLSMPRIVSLQDQGGEGYDAFQAQHAYRTEKNRQPEQADYAQEFVTATSYLLSAPGVVYSQPDFNQVRDQLHPMGGGSDHNPTGYSKHGSLPTTASHYAMTLRHPDGQKEDSLASTAMKRPPSMVTEFAQYLSEQRQQHQQYQLPYLQVKPSTTEYYAAPQKSKPPLHPSTSMASSAGQHHHSKSQHSLLDGSKSVAGFNDEFFRAIPVVEESGLDDVSVYSKDSFQKSKPAKNQHNKNHHKESFDEEKEDDDSSNNGNNSLPIHRLGEQKPVQLQSHMQMSPSMLDLRSDILAFMAKANSQMTHEYAGYLDPQLSKTQAHTNKNNHNASSIIQQSRAAASGPSGASITSQTSVQSSLPEEHQHLTKLWDQLRGRYAGDREGAHEMKKKIREYIHHGIKEENQVNRAYMEEIEDCRDIASLST